MKRAGMAGWLILAMLASGCTVDFLTRDRFLDCDFEGTTLIVSSDHKENSIDLKPYVGGNGPCGFTVLFPDRHDGSAYLLLDASSQSTADSAGPCAQGTEQNLIWLKLDAGLQVQDAKSVLVASCLQDIHGLQNYHQTDDSLTMKYVRSELVGDGGNVRSRQSESNISYDNNHPEAGLVVETHEVK